MGFQQRVDITCGCIGTQTCLSRTLPRDLGPLVLVFMGVEKCYLVTLSTSCCAVFYRVEAEVLKL